MATATAGKSKNRVAATVKEKARSVKNSVTGAAKKAANGVKNTAKATVGDLGRAYAQGYMDGHKAATAIPKRAGAVTAATCGYSKGIRDKKKSEKIQNRVSKATKR